MKRKRVLTRRAALRHLKNAVAKADKCYARPFDGSYESAKEVLVHHLTQKLKRYK